MKIAVFLSHPIQYFSPLWQELSSRDGVKLKVFYYSKQSVVPTMDERFGVRVAWDVDMLGGYESEFLPRRWPTTDPLDCTWKGINSGIAMALDGGWDVAFVSGYAHLNNWAVAMMAKRRGIKLLSFSDTSVLTIRRDNFIKRAAKRFFVRTVDSWLVAGDHAKAYIEHNGGESQKIFICPFVVNVNRYRSAISSATAADLDAVRKQYNIPAGKKLIMFCGKIIPLKEPLDLVNAVKAINRDDVISVFVGDGQMRKQVEQAGGDKVVVCGFVNQKQLPVLLSLGQMLVLPSSHEQYGIVSGEALCVGLPVIVSDRCGCWGPSGAVRDGVSGFVYPVGDVSALAGKITRLLDDEPLRKSMIDAGRQIADGFSQSHAADTFLAAAEAAVVRGREKAT